MLDSGHLRMLKNLEQRLQHGKPTAGLATALALSKTQVCDCELGRDKYEPFRPTFYKDGVCLRSVHINPFDKNMHCLKAHPCFGEEPLTMDEYNRIRLSFQADPLDEMDKLSIYCEAEKYYPFVKSMKHLLGLSTKRRRFEEYEIRHLHSRKVTYGEGDEDEVEPMPAAMAWATPPVVALTTSASVTSGVKRNANSLRTVEDDISSDNLYNFAVQELRQMLTTRVNIPDPGDVPDAITARGLRNLMDSKKALVMAIETVGGIQLPDSYSTMVTWKDKKAPTVNALTCCGTDDDEGDDEDDDECLDKYICVLQAGDSEEDAEFLVNKHMYQTSRSVQKSEASKKRRAERILRGETKRQCASSRSPKHVDTPTKYMKVIVADMGEKDMLVFAERNRRRIVKEYRRNIRRIQTRRSERETKRHHVYCYNTTLGRKDPKEIPPYFDAATDFFAAN